MSMPVRLTTALAAAVLALAAPAVADAAFTVVPSPNAPAGQNNLSGVRASSTTDAWAVGYSCCRPNNFGQATLTEHWDGRSWSIVPSPDTRFNDDLLNAVVDLSPTNAWAVGQVKQSGYRTGSPLILHWDGSSWQSVPPPSGTTSGQLLAASAMGPNDVWAVGDDLHGQPLVLHYNGVAWARQTVPQLTGAGHLRGVRPWSASNVWAVGDESSQVLVLHWNGSGWIRMPTPNPDPFTNVLHAIGGNAANDFWVVGQNARSKTSTGVPPGTRTFAMHWDGASWGTPATPNQGDEDSLRGVVGYSGGTTAVGTFQNPTTGSLRTLAERFNGSSWAISPTPNVGTADNWLRADSPIPGTAEVWAVGAHLTSGGPGQTLIMRGS